MKQGGQHLKSVEKLEKTNQRKNVPKISDTLAKRCSRCGAVVALNDSYCSSCAAPLSVQSCSRCGGPVEPGWEICPACGDSLLKGICSFCGAALSAEDAFCTVCRNPREGLECPACHTLNFRNFCRHCNNPLNSLAEQAVREARNDPKITEAVALLGELTALERLLEPGDESKLSPSGLTEEDHSVLAQYRDIISAFRQGDCNRVAGETGQEERSQGSSPKTVSAQRNNFKIEITDREEALRKYRVKLSEIQELLSSMTPDASMTPHQQRDYCSARKVEIMSRVNKKVPIGWICHAYGCTHNQPNECSKPYCGGKWIYEVKEELISKWVHQ
ncbi:MAG: zinc ribbon domain-containing protein [Proteiniphilum sp.]|nr:zinc ribbon domain-containing protein [Proteiniphilum sp.]